MASRKEQREEARAARQARETAEREQTRRKRRIWQLGAILVGATAIVIAAIAISSSGGSKAGSASGPVLGAQTTQQLLAGIPQQGTTLGNPQAPVTLIEFADLQCPFCRDYTTKDFAPTVAKYVRPGKVKMIFRNLTFIGQDSVTAAQAAAAAGTQGKLWNFADVFYSNQGPENSGYVTDAFLRKVAAGVPGLNADQMLNGRGAPAVQQELGQAQALAQQMNVTSTPTFILERAGKPPTTVTNTAQLGAMIDKLLAG